MISSSSLDVVNTSVGRTCTLTIVEMTDSKVIRSTAMGIVLR